jgi:hypothetical protein
MPVDVAAVGVARIVIVLTDQPIAQLGQRLRAGRLL